MALEPLETAEGSDYPACLQLTVFLENRVGQLLRLTRLLDGRAVRILALTTDAAADCGTIRLLVDHPETARQMLCDAGFAVAESELVVVELPPGKRGIMTVCAALISGEVSIHYAYPLLGSKKRGPCLAIHADNLPQAVDILTAKGFNVLDQAEL
jgi:hypothetical protein